MSIIIFIIAIAVLILVHEFGHFIVAKKFGVRVDEFGFGFPPKIFGKKYGETEYTLNLIPFGGFVKIFGENPTDDALNGPDKARSFVNQPKIKQAMILGAGVFFNVLLAWGLISVGFMSGMPIPVSAAPESITITNSRMIVTNVADGSPAEAAGLMAGDTLVSFEVGGERYEQLTVSGIQDFVARHGEDEIAVVYTRGGKPFLTSAVPEKGIFGESPAIGIGMDEIGIVKLAPHLAIWEGGKMTIVMTGAIAAAFSNLIIDAVTGNVELSNLTGPVGIVGLIGDAAGFGLAYLLGFVALISLNLAILNLLPIPALDGGRLFFLAIETVKGSRLSPKFVNIAHSVGFAALILLMLIITYNDIAKIFNGS